MSIFHHPPPIFVGGRQPYAPREFVPAAGSVISTDVVASIEWSLENYAPPGRRRYPGIGPSPLIVQPPRAFDLGATPFSVTIDSATPTDWSAAAFFDSITPIEFRSSVIGDAASTIEWSLSTIRDSVIPVEWRSNFVSDVSSSIDWSLLFLRDATIPFEFSLTAIRDTVIPSEWLDTITRDTIVYDESSLTAIRDGDAPTEWNASPSFDLSPSIEWRASCLIDRSAPSEWNLSVRLDQIDVVQLLTSMNSDATIPDELGASWAVDKLAPAEWGLSINANSVPPLELVMGPRSDGVIAPEWTTIQLIDTVAPVEWRSAPLFNATISTEWRSLQIIDTMISTDWQETTAITVPMSLELLTTRIQDENIPAEFGTGIASNILVFVEWTGPVSVTLDAATWIEWRASLTADQPMAVEMLATETVSSAAPLSRDVLYQADVSGSAAWLISLSAFSTASPIEFISMRISDISSGIYWTTPTLQDSVVPSEYVGTVPRTVTDDAVISLDFLASAQIDVNQPVEFTSGVAITLMAWADLGLGLASDSMVPLDFLSPTTINAPVPIDFTGQIELVTSDGEAPLEFTTSVASDVTLYADWPWPARRVKGATIEVRSTPTTKPIAEGSGTKGSTLTR